MKVEMDFEAIGVVPTQDDLQWVWEDLQDGGLLQDLLLSSVLPSPQKPSAVFVEAHANVNNSGYQYEEEMNMEMNEWYTNMEMTFDLTASNDLKQSTPVTTTLHKDTVAPNKYNYFDYHQEYTQEAKMDFASSEASAILQTLPMEQPQFLPENEVNAYLNSNEQSMTSPTEADQNDMYRTGVSSVYSNSSWESFADDSSHTTELSQEEIFEEIQRECAEIERKSMSPKLPKSSRSIKKQSRASRKIDAEERKKELNRVAAAKYREKRRIERDGKMVELEQLESRNRKLRSQASGLENEIKYLRDLIKEIRHRREEE